MPRLSKKTILQGTLENIGKKCPLSGKDEKDLISAMILIRTIMNVLPQKQKEFSQTLLSLIESSGKENGCLDYSVFCDIEDENIFNVISEWETRQHLDHYISSNRFRVLLGTKSLLCEPLKIQILTVPDSYPLTI